MGGKMISTDLDADDILAACATYVPVNVRVDQAIEAHRIAHGAAQSDPEARQLAMFVLRAIVVARTPAVADRRAPRDYLGTLPETAWPENAGWSARVCQQQTLAAIARRSIGWRRVERIEYSRAREFTPAGFLFTASFMPLPAAPHRGLQSRLQKLRLFVAKLLLASAPRKSPGQASFAARPPCPAAVPSIALTAGRGR